MASSVWRRVLVGSVAAGGLALVAGTAANLTRRDHPWSHPPSDQNAATILLDPQWPRSFPLSSEHLSRIDERDDADFYTAPRFGQHIDQSAVAALREYYKQAVPRDAAVLDLMSSWTSHLDLLTPGKSSRSQAAGDQQRPLSYMSAVGLNELELRANPLLDDFHVKDLNRDPSLREYESGRFAHVVMLREWQEHMITICLSQVRCGVVLAKCGLPDTACGSGAGGSQGYG